MRIAALVMAAAGALGGASALHAHHSISMIEISTPVWIAGTVVRYEPKQPHALITLDEALPDGHVRRWTVEGPTLSRLARYGVPGDLLESGDAIEICGFAPKDRDRFPPAFLHGHLLVLPDQRMQPWGPYGKLDNCVRAVDGSARWLEFLRQPMVRELWCHRYPAEMPTSPLASSALVSEIKDRLSPACP